MALVIAACGGSEGSGSSSLLGGGQDPDPVIQDFPVAYVARPLQLDDNGDLVEFDIRDPQAMSPGAELFVRDRASPSAIETSITSGVFPGDAMGNTPMYDVKDLSTSYDGTKLVFAMRAPQDPNLDDDEQPTWNIWIYDHDTAVLRRVIGSDTTAEAGHDIAPRFLPDDRILFASTRQRQAKAILLDEGKPQFSNLDESRRTEAFVLHVMDNDGSNIHQITFNQSHDLDPYVLDSGRVLFSRWDNAGGVNRISLYTAKPDGRDVQILYGAHSHDTGPNGEAVEFVNPVELPDGRILVQLTAASRQSHLGALPTALDAANYVEHDQPTASNAGLMGPAQEPLIIGDVQIADAPSPAGRYASVVPIYDGTGRLLVTWSQCRLLDPESPDPLDPDIIPCTDLLLQDPAVEEANPLYGIWVYDPRDDTQQPVLVPEEGMAFTEAVVFEPRVVPNVILDGVAGIDLDPDLVNEATGILHIRSVYDFDGIDVADIPALRDPAQTLAAERPARFVRFVKSVSMPDDDVLDIDDTAFGRSTNQLMRETLGYAVVEPDGSVKAKLPANVPFAVSVLDANGRRITARHQNWLQLRPGEERECVGCHTPQSELPHGRDDALPPSANPGAPADGQPFPNTLLGLEANAGESMAETYTRINGAPSISVDIAYQDVWTNASVRAPDAPFAYAYADLTTPPPVDPTCVTAWDATCRIIVNYETHIHPLWNTPRAVLDAVGNVIQDVTCTGCHNNADAAGAVTLPAAQLDLSDGQSAEVADLFKSYHELTFDSNIQTLLNGQLTNQLVQDVDDDGNLLFQTDADGNLILDSSGNPIPVLVPATQEPPIRVAGANASPRFFDRFGSGGSHAGWLSPAELKLLSEWVDVGAQYYNNPFDVPP